MSNLDTETLKNMATELAKSVKTQADLSELSWHVNENDC